MPFGSSSPIALNGALFQTGLRQYGLQVQVAAPTTAILPNGDFSLIRPGSGEIVYVKATGFSGATITTAGPVAGGRDRAAAFPNNSMVHFYNISDGVTVSAIASLSPPYPLVTSLVNRSIGTMLLGPVLPTGYLFWNYAGMVPMNGANLYPGRYDNDWYHFEPTPVNVLNSAAVNVNPILANLLGLLAGTTDPASAAISLLYNLRATLTTNALGVASSDLTFDEGLFEVGTTFTLPVEVNAVLSSVSKSTQITASRPVAPSFAWVNDVNPANIALRNFLLDVAAFKPAFSMKS
jgi:hypothetical protein